MQHGILCMTKGRMAVFSMRAFQAENNTGVFRCRKRPADRGGYSKKILDFFPALYYTLGNAKNSIEMR